MVQRKGNGRDDHKDACTGRAFAFKTGRDLELQAFACPRGHANHQAAAAGLGWISNARTAAFCAAVR
nr:hypothetical protein [Novacetimonas pomaceti]